MRKTILLLGVIMIIFSCERKIQDDVFTYDCIDFAYNREEDGSSEYKEEYYYIDGLLVKLLDKYGNSIVYEYNHQGLLIRSYSDDYQIVKEYNAFGDLLSESRYSGVSIDFKIDYIYDEERQLFCEKKVSNNDLQEKFYIWEDGKKRESFYVSNALDTLAYDYYFYNSENPSEDLIQKENYTFFFYSNNRIDSLISKITFSKDYIYRSETRTNYYENGDIHTQEFIQYENELIVHHSNKSYLIENDEKMYHFISENKVSRNGINSYFATKLFYNNEFKPSRYEIFFDEGVLRRYSKIDNSTDTLKIVEYDSNGLRISYKEFKQSCMVRNSDNFMWHLF